MRSKLDGIKYICSYLENWKAICREQSYDIRTEVRLSIVRPLDATIGVLAAAINQQIDRPQQQKRYVNIPDILEVLQQ